MTTRNAMASPLGVADDVLPLDETGESVRDALTAELSGDVDFAGIGNRLVAKIDDKIARLAQDAPPRHAMACKAGCVWCCHQGVDVTVPEASLIAAYVEREFAPEARAELAERIHSVTDRTRGMTPVERMRAAIPCAFLGKDGDCRIYPVRPMLCRAVMSADAERCRQAFIGGASGTEDVWSAPVDFATQLLLGTAAAYRLATGSRGVYELHAILSAAFARIDQAAGPSER